MNIKTRNIWLVLLLLLSLGLSVAHASYDHYDFDKSNISEILNDCDECTFYHGSTAINSFYDIYPDTASEHLFVSRASNLTHTQTYSIYSARAPPRSTSN